LPDGFYLTSSPIWTVDWKANSGQQWTVPLGGGVGKIFHLGKLAISERGWPIHFSVPSANGRFHTRL